MKQIIQKTKSGFESIKKVLGSVLHQEGKRDAGFFNKLKEEIAVTYVIMNESFCEEVAMCHSCAQNRDRLYEMMELLENDTLLQGDVAFQNRHLSAFMNDIDEVLVRIDKVLASL